jgi:hypothetical protein
MYQTISDFITTPDDLENNESEMARYIYDIKKRVEK